MAFKDPLLGKKFKDYLIVERIGGGAFGAVYKAQHARLSGKFFAIKVLHPHIAADTEIIKRFEREAESLALLDHPNIVQIIDFDSSDEVGYYIVMEWLKGKPLSKYLKKKKRLSLKETEEIFLQLLVGLGEAHKKGIVHRDLKPANLMLVPTGNSLLVKILDFGIAALKSDDQGLTSDGTAMGSANYMSPEQAMGKVREIDSRSDLYSCGIIFGKCLTGRNIFTGESQTEILMKHIQAPPPKLNELYPAGNFSPELEAFFAKSIAKKKEDRFQTAREFAEAMKAAIHASELGVGPKAAVEASPGLNVENVRVIREVVKPSPAVATTTDTSAEGNSISASRSQSLSSSKILASSTPPIKARKDQGRETPPKVGAESSVSERSLSSSSSFGQRGLDFLDGEVGERSLTGLERLRKQSGSYSSLEMSGETSLSSLGGASGSTSSPSLRGEMSFSSSLSRKGSRSRSKSAKIVKVKRDDDGFLWRLKRGHVIILGAVVFLLASIAVGYFIFRPKPKDNVEDKIWQEAEKSTVKQSEILKMIIKKKDKTDKKDKKGE